MPRQAWHQGARVSRPSATEWEPLLAGQHRRKRKRIYGTILGPDGDTAGRFLVRWDDGTRGSGLDRGPQGLKLEPSGAGRHNQSPLPGVRANDAAEDDAEDADGEDDDVDDAGSDGDFFSFDNDQEDDAAEDDVEGPREARAPGSKLAQDMAAIARLAGNSITVNDVTWTVVSGVGELHTPGADTMPQSAEPVAAAHPIDSELDAFTCMLWKPMGDMVEDINQAALRDKRDRWRAVTASELATWFGLFLGSTQFAESGDRLWKPKFQTFVDSGFKDIMSLKRFKDIRKYISFTMAKLDAHDTDDWWRARRGVELFNAKRGELIGAVPRIILDESMSAWRPDTTKTGGLPAISFVLRKPEPLGTEFKTAADPHSGIMLQVEIQEGRQRMRDKGGHPLPTTACVTRLVSGIPAASLGMRRTVFGDSWFSNVATAVQIGRCEEAGNESGDRELRAGGGGEVGVRDHYVGIIKNGKKRFPKHWIEAQLEGKSAGTYVVLTATVEGVELVALGWKYHRKSTVCFVTTRGAGSTRVDPESPHVMRWRNERGDASSRDIQRPEVVGAYYAVNNVIDVHNQLRQYELKLEKKWVTTDCWFRLFTTLVGICTVDAYRLYQNRKPRLASGMTMQIFAGVVAKQLLSYVDVRRGESQTPVAPPPPPTDPSTVSRTGSAPAGCSRAASSVNRSDACELVEIDDVQNREGGDKRKACHVCWKVRGKKQKTSTMCVGVRCRERGICHPSTSRDCWSVHVGNVRRQEGEANGRDERAGARRRGAPLS